MPFSPDAQIPRYWLVMCASSWYPQAWQDVAELEVVALEDLQMSYLGAVYQGSL